MSVPIQNKNRRKQSNYVVNLSLDIPVESDRFVIDKPVSGQFTIFPAQAKKNLKLKLGSARTTQQPQSRRITIAADSYRINSARNDKKITNHKSSNKSSAMNMKHTRHTSCIHSKSPSRILNKSNKQSLLNTEPFNMKIFKNKIIYAVDDDIIDYTSPSAELLKEESLLNFRQRFNKHEIKKCHEMRSELITPPLQVFRPTQSDEIDLLSDIKKIEKNAIERKKQINMDYMLRKIKMQACARKIQRAWRNYRTKRLLHAYSHSFSLRYTNKMKEMGQGLIPEKKVLNVRSCGYKNGQNQLKMKFKNQRVQPRGKSPKQEEQQKSSRKAQINQLQKQLQLEQIKKWQELIKQLRKTKDVQQILHKAQENKQQLQLKNNKQMKKEENRLISSISKIQNQQAKQQIKQALSALESKDSKDKKESEAKNWFNLIKINTFDGQVEEESISPKSEIVEKIEIIPNKSQQKNINIDSQNSNEFFHIRLTPNSESSQDFQSPDKQKKQSIQSQPTTPKPQHKVYKSKNQQRKQKKSNLRQKLMKYAKNKHRFTNKLKYVEYEIISEIACEILKRESDELKELYLLNKMNKKEAEELLKQPTDASNKEQGICTSMQSIKDYLQNLISFLFEQYPDQFIQAFNIPAGYTTAEILKPNIQNIKINPSIMDRSLFDSHWECASQQIYFEQKYDNRELEVVRVQRLKNITKIFFMCIFDGFNQCLSYQRIYGSRGEPYVWQIQPVPKQTPLTNIDSLKPKIKSSFRRLSQQASTFCGMLTQDKCRHLSQELQQDIKYQRMNVFLEYEMKNSNYVWENIREDKTRVLLELSQLILQELVIQFGLDFPQ